MKCRRGQLPPRGLRSTWYQVIGMTKKYMEMDESAIISFVSRAVEEYYKDWLSDCECYECQATRVFDMLHGTKEGV